jgi:Bacteriophage minor capsid protein
MTPTAVLEYAIKSILPDFPYPIFSNHMPNSPDNAVLLVETGRGKLETRSQRTAKRKERPQIQVIVRGSDSSARDILQSLSDATQAIRRLDLPDGQKLHVIIKSNTIGFAGQEPQTRRYVYTQQFRLILE